MLSTSEKWKDTINRDDRKCRAFLSLSGTIISDDLFDYKIKDTIYDDDFIGSFVKKRCDINVLNKQRKYNFDNQKIQVYAGLEYDDSTTEYLFLGTYIVTSATYDDVNYQSTLECYDLSTLFDVPYKNTVTYPCTVRQYLKACCDSCNIIMSDKSFNMEDVLLSSEPYLDDGSTYRDAIRQICKMCLSCGQIINDELVLTTVNRIDKTSDFTINDFFDLSTEAAIGPYNVLVLSRTPQEDNYVYPTPLPENPVEYRVENNVIIDKNRELYAPIMYNFINGLTFIPCSITLLKGRPEICSLDYFTFNDMEEIERQSIVFTHEFTFDGNFSSTISCTAKSQTQTNYKRAGTLTKRVQTTELWVDKAKGEIEALIRDMYEEDGIVNENYAKLLVDISNILLMVQNSGGNNLIKNSVGFAGTQEWDVSFNDDSSSVDTVTGTYLLENGISGGAFVLNGVKLSQQIIVSSDTFYSFSCKVSKKPLGSGYIKIYNQNDESQTWIKNLGSNEELSFEEIKFEKISITGTTLVVELYGEKETDLTITDSMLNKGELLSQWTQANGEILNVQVNITQKGVVVKSLQFEQNGQYTTITPLEFAGHAKVNGVDTVVFTVNGDTTIAERLRARKEIAMNPIKIVPITGTNNNGWAFVGDTGGEDL